MFIHLDPTATVSVWQPKDSERGVTLADDEMVSGFKIFCPYHLLVSLKTVVSLAGVSSSSGLMLNFYFSGILYFLNIPGIRFP
jgi:hypothetical protein